MHDETPANIASGYGGWIVVSRDRGVGLTQWNGKDPLRMAIPILFDGVSRRLGQEIGISNLSRMALPPTSGGEPPTLTATGPGIPKVGPVVWVIENLQWGTNVNWDFADNGVYVRTRQDCVVNLLQYVAGDRLAFKNIQPGSITAGKVTAGWPKQYVVATGDTLRLIAAQMYGDGSWPKVKIIMKANVISDANSIYLGQVLRIPAP